MAISKTATRHEFTCDDVTGLNLLTALQNEEVYRITLEGEKSPSIGFCERLYKDWKFATEDSVEFEPGKFRTTFVRENSL